MSKKQDRIDELQKQIFALEQERIDLQINLKKSKGVLQQGDAYVVTYKEGGVEQHAVYYCGVGVVCLNAYFDCQSTFLFDILSEVEQYIYDGSKAKGKKMSLIEAIKYL